ncbi:TetR family transcriptional regulator [Prauserella shujinwangii]|uniref:TetR family transcriptional regulator n=1 Tax=Prauserella shujinwangii TaxID=1453103 RepID=A0A2T0M2L0_9PSEU|nr:TetR/AcrR family transcriptional regulator [Prauserella shujinwangii]PRX50978.1 TetR family transcriptional regulator [Prauserella shujinwangii]
MAGTTEATSARQRLFAAAERLMLDSGYERVSVRAVNAAAGMNPAAVHYHFGSKDAFAAALLEDRLGPLWEEPLAALERRRAEGSVPTARELVDVAVGPLLPLAAEPKGRLWLHMLARLTLGRRAPEWSSRWFGLEPWVDLLRQARPGLTAGAARARWVAGFTLILHAFGDPLADVPRAEAVPDVPPDVLVAFVAAGLDAPPGERR